MKIELNCAGCGGNRFALGRIAADADMVLCEECGSPVGTVAELKQRVAGQVTGRAAARRSAIRMMPAELPE